MTLRFNKIGDALNLDINKIKNTRTLKFIRIILH